MTQNEIYEMVADFGEAYGTALRRDSYLVRGIDWPENWLALPDIVTEERAELLSAGHLTPTPEEFKSLIQWQVEKALSEENPSITPTIWFCQTHPDSDVIAIEGWGDSMATELKFVEIGRYADRFDALKELQKLYIFSVDDL